MTQTPCFDAPEIQEASRELSQFVTTIARQTAEELGFGWRPAVVAPTDLESLRAEFKACRSSGLPLRVSYANCDRTVFDQPATNWANRFWHDTRHLWLGADFDLDGEMEVASCQLKRLLMGGFSQDSVTYRLLFSDTVGQTSYLHRVGTFVQDQRRFALRCLVSSLDEAIEAEWLAELSEAVA